RATDSITPLTLGLAIAVHLSTPRLVAGHCGEELSVASGSAAPQRDHRRWIRCSTVVLTIVTASLLVAVSTFNHLRSAIPIATRFDTLTYQRGVEPIAAQRQAYSDWRAVCRWVDQTLPADEVLITPRHQQTFKWYAQRAEVVNWKDVPQDAESLVQWYERFFEIYPRRLGTVRVTIRYPRLQRGRDHFGARFVIVDRRVVGPNLPLLLV